MPILKPLLPLLFWVLFFASSFADDLKIATLNAYLCFDPAITRNSHQIVGPESEAEYQTKLSNLATLINGYQIVALQEMGGKEEVEALAVKAGFRWAFTKGNDTFTGQNVALLYNLPDGWKVTISGRVAALEKLSKHLLVKVHGPESQWAVLVVHLIRPIGAQKAKHDTQIEAISAWATTYLLENPGHQVIVAGDFNDTTVSNDSSLIGSEFREVGEAVGWEATHLDGRPYDHLIFPKGLVVSSAQIVAPPFGRRPNNLLKMEWTDHYLLGAILSTLKQ